MRNWKHKLPPSHIHDYTIKLQTWLLLSSKQQEHQRLEQSLPDQIHSEKNNDDDDKEDNDSTLTRTCAGTVTSTRPRTRMTLSIIIIIVITTCCHSIIIINISTTTCTTRIDIKCLIGIESIAISVSKSTLYLRS